MKKNLLSVVAFLAAKGFAEGVQSEGFKALKPEEQAKLFDELNAHNQEVVDEMRSDISTTKEQLQKAIDELRAGQVEQLKTLNASIAEVGLSVKKLSENGKPMGEPEKTSLKALIADHSETLKSIRAKKDNRDSVRELTGKISMTVTKGTQGASDIGGRDYLGEIEPGIEHKPVRKTSILDLFRRKNVSTEYLHYWEEDVVTRDAKFVVACAASTHNTKKTWAKRTVELAKIRDIVDICIDMLEDYDFVESEIRQLIDESIMLKAEYDLLLGAAAAATDMLSIDSIASEFNPSNVLAPFADSIEKPTIGDLTAAMKAQIFVFGQENKWQADTIVMNYVDMIKYLHAKDADGQYLFPNFVMGATDRINDMRIVTSPICAANTLYVFDSTKGSILNRKALSVTASYENNDNVEKELVTFVASARMQFHVRNINRDAFMKCSDIALALAQIKVVAS